MTAWDWVWMALTWAGFGLAVFNFVTGTLPSLKAEHRARQEARRRADGYAPPWFLGWLYWFGLDAVLLRHKMRPQCLMCEHPETEHCLRGEGFEDWRHCNNPACECLNGLFLFEKRPPVSVHSTTNREKP